MPRLVLLAFIWGWSFLFMKVAVEGVTPATIAWGRIALGALVLWAVVHRRGLRVPFDRTMARHFVVVAVFGNVLPFMMLAWANQHITSALTAVLNASTPLFTALCAAVALSERLKPVQVAGLGVGVVGVAVAAGLGADDLSGSSVVASLAASFAGAGYGLAFVYMRRHLLSIPPVVAATGQLTAGALLLWPLALATSLVDGLSLTPTRITSVVLLGVAGTGLAYVLSYSVIAELGPTRASLVTYLVPVVAVLVGIVVLDEPFGWRIVVGGVLTIVGISAVNRKAVKPDEAAAELGAPGPGVPDPGADPDGPGAGAGPGGRGGPGGPGADRGAGPAPAQAAGRWATADHRSSP